MTKIREAIETIAIYAAGTFAVLIMCLLYLICRICGVRLEEDDGD